MILGDWIWQFTYAVFDGEHMFMEQYVEGESQPNLFINTYGPRLVLCLMLHEAGARALAFVTPMASLLGMK